MMDGYPDLPTQSGYIAESFEDVMHSLCGEGGSPNETIVSNGVA